MENKDNDTVEKMKGFFSSAFTATKEASVKAYDKTSEFASDTYKKADQKYNDPEFQQDMSDFKTKVSTGAKEAAETTEKYAKKGYKGFKKGIMSAWNFVQEKIDDKPKEMKAKDFIAEQELKEKNQQQDQQQQQYNYMDAAEDQYNNEIKYNEYEDLQNTNTNNNDNNNNNNLI